ncbi:hypothetical protein TSUD_39370 [Trifolium subterraneum]|uniref:RING-type E3 ubiquitin transferase n=1 Tax=Trifolium subterraneum TaxID=3900 RepID=A0A2Z6MLU6_TRISU|nr:hypothetical protein TSUD_39370 [Trifolium subterraneum]
MKGNDDRSWMQQSALILSTRKEVPWYLDDGTGRVLVVGACASGNETFVDSGQARICGIGTSIEGSLKASRDDDGTIRIQRPAKGPFYVSHKTIDAHIADFASVARWCKCASVSLTVFGVWLMTKRCGKDCMEIGSSS